GRKGHAKALYDETVLVPLIVRFPRRVARGRIIDRQVRLMDVAPTILGLSGVPIPAGFGAPRPAVGQPGEGLAPWLDGELGSDKLRDLVAFSESEALARKMDAVRTGSFKLIRREEGRRRELFDLRADPGERRNLLATAEGGKQALALEAMIDGWVRSVASA